MINYSAIDVSSEAAKRAELEGFENASSDDVGREYDERMGNLMEYFMGVRPSQLSAP